MPLSPSYDLCVIGAGPGGFAAATRAAQRGARVALVEARELGGVCLNTGCIPARAIGTTAWLAAAVRRGAALGVKIGGYEIVWPDAVARKDRIVRRLREGLYQLAQARKIALIAGRAVVAGRGEVEVTPTDGGPRHGLTARGIIVATGSSPNPLPTIPFDGTRVLSSDDLLRLPALPKRLAVIGGGVVGCEFASYLAPLGVAVTVFEQAPQLLPGQDLEIAQALEAVLTKAGAKVYTGTRIVAVAVTQEGVTLRWGDGQIAAADQVLVTVGRRPNTQALGLEQAGVTLNGGGFVPVDEHLRTSAAGCLAIGDILGQYQTAYTATYEGAVAAENALGGTRRVDYAAVPECIFTMPEIAAVGLTERQAQSQGFPTAVSRIPWSASGRAMTLDETEGLIKVVFDAQTQRLLGVQMMGPRATDLIAEASLALRQGLTLSAVVEVLHGHPTLAETLWEASAQPLMQSLYVR